MKYKAIGFDYGGVIYGLPGPVFMSRVASLLDVSREELSKKFFENNHKSNIEKIGWNELWKHIAESLDRLDKSEELIEFVQDWDKEQKINQDVIELIKKVDSLGYKIGLLSNYAEGLRERLDKQKIAELFDVIGISSEMGTMKPQPEAFLKFCEMLDVKPSELIYIDDSKKSLETAESIGYVPVLFRDYETLLDDLTLLGVAEL